MTRSDARSPDYMTVPYRLPSDWRVLRDTIIKSLEMSPDAFLTSLEQVQGEGQAFWDRKLGSAQWAVVQRDGQALGIAAAKPPVETDDYAVPGKACFIESIWIDPRLREQGVGRRLVTYLIEQQRLVGIQDFYIWVFNHNDPAIHLYDRMDFKRTGRDSKLPETQFLRKFDSEVVDDEELRHNRAERATDKSDFGITYRILA
jgi:ribosomal protein S18 acetylase RimI-like enzyme